MITNPVLTVQQTTGNRRVDSIVYNLFAGIIKHRFLGLVSVCLLAVLSHTTESLGATRYNLTDLGVPYGLHDTGGVDINNNGTVLVKGWASGWYHAYLWKNGALTAIQSNETYTSVSAINDNEWVTGYSTSDASVSRAYIWRNGSFTYLGENAGGQDWSRPDVLSNSGEIYGYNSMGDSYNTAQAFSWINGQFSKLGIIDVGFGASSTGSFKDESFPTCINDRGQLVGTTVRTEYGPGPTSTSRVRSWIMENGTINVLPPPSGVTPDTWATRLINNNGDIIGTGMFSDGYHSALLSNGVLTELSDLSGGIYCNVFDMNSHDLAVGSTYVDWNQRAILWDHAQVVDLNTLVDNLPSGWTLSNAHGVNEMGQIVGEVKDANGVYRAYLLTPVPEPSTVVLLGIGIISLMWRSNNRRRLRARED